VAGVSGSTDGIGGGARFNLPRSVAVDPNGNVYVADYFNLTIRKITPAGLVTTLAGTPGAPGNVDATGAAARFDYPIGVAVDGSGKVYVADSEGNTVRLGTPNQAPTVAVHPPPSRHSSTRWGFSFREQMPTAIPSLIT